MKDWLSAAAISRPEGAAVILPDGKHITYAELQNLCAAQAVMLVARGVGQGDRIAVLMENSLRYVVLVHAIMRLGAVLIPLNTRLTPEELRYQLEACAAAFLCFDARHRQTAELLGSSQCTLIECDGEWQSLLGGDTSCPAVAIELNAVCAIVFTSGTSGKPKGAQLTYGNFLYSAMASAYRLGTAPQDRWLICLPMFHVGGLSILHRASLYNTTVVLSEGSFDAFRIVKQIKHDQVTMLSVVPTQLYRLLQADDGNLAKLRLILLGGAPGTPELLAQARQHNLNLAATYGLTEAASQVATASPEQTYAKPGTVGRPLPFTAVRIVDEAGNTQLTGEIGEVCVSGPTLMRGYLGQPDIAPDGWFKTGDIGYQDEDGDLYIMQRRSDLIISGGENIYPAEIESALRAHPDVQDVIVVGIPDVEWGQKVAAVVIAREGSALTHEQAAAFCADKLARYKCPRAYLFVNAFPLTASGKVDRRAVTQLFSR